MMASTVSEQGTEYIIFIFLQVFDDDTICRPYLLIPKLPAFPATNWTTMRISRAANGGLEHAISFEELSKIDIVWHSRSIDVHSLKRMKMYRSAVHEVLFEGLPAISKIACFEWDIRINHETWAYSILDHDYQQNTNSTRIAPKFLGHLTENGRVIGMLLEKLEGEFASIDDLPACSATLLKLHNIGLVHGDC